MNDVNEYLNFFGYDITPEFQEQYEKVLEEFREPIAQLCEALQKCIIDASAALKPLLDNVIIVNSNYDAQKHPRVVHLAYYHRKARVRKKNMNRLRRMK